MADNLSFNQEMLSMNMYKKAKQILRRWKQESSCRQTLAQHNE
jgi:hypothetical protein